MVSLGPLNIRLDLLMFMGALLLLYFGLKSFGLSNKQRDDILGTWFAGFLAWKGSAILIGLISTGDFRLALFATGGTWSLLFAGGVIAWLVFKLDDRLRGYWMFSALVMWLATTLAVPTYGTLPLISSTQPIHLFSAGLIVGLIGLTWRWMSDPTFGRLIWTGVGAFAIWRFESYALGAVQLWSLVAFFILLVISVYAQRPSKKSVQIILAAIVVLAVANAVIPDTTKSLNAGSNDSTGLNIGQTPPAFELKRTDGSTFDSESLRGRRVVVNFWASWCPPCRAEMPDMATFAKEREDVTIVAVNTTTNERDPEDATRFVAPYEDDFIVVYDQEGVTSDAYRIQAMPTTYVLDESGVIIAKQFGAIDRAWLHAHLK